MLSQTSHYKYGKLIDSSLSLMICFKLGSHLFESRVSHPGVLPQGKQKHARVTALTPKEYTSL